MLWKISEKIGKSLKNGKLFLITAILTAVLTIPTPVYAASQSMVTNLGGGMYYSAVLRSDGTVWAWGVGEYGQLGNGTMEDSLVPVQVQFPEAVTITEISVGRWHVAAIDSTGRLWSWGTNTYGQLADGTTEDKSTPVLSSAFNGKTIVAVSAGYYHNFALDNTGVLWSWGLNDRGQLGLGNSTNQLTPQEVPLDNLAGRSIIAISTGTRHTAVVADDGTVWTCGRTDYGILGRDTTVSNQSLGQVQGVNGIFFEEIAIGTEHMIARTITGGVYVWGGSSQGQLGNGLTGNNNPPTEVQALSGETATAVFASDEHTAVLDSNGIIWAWGKNVDGQLGNGSSGGNSLIPGKVSSLNSVANIAGGYNQMVAIKSDGSVWDWGGNAWGQLGNGTTTAAVIATRIDASLEADRVLNENNLNGVQLTAHVNLDSLKNDMTASQFSLQNAPAGLSISGVQRISATQCVINLAFDGTDFDTNISNFGVMIAASALQGGQAITLDSLEIEGVNETHIGSDQVLTETNLNGRTLTLGLQTDTFADATLDVANFTLNNAPSGLIITTAQAISTTECALSLSFDGTDFDSNITNLTVTIAGNELTGASPLNSDKLSITAVQEATTNHSSGGSGSASVAAKTYQAEVQEEDGSEKSLSMNVDINKRIATVGLGNEPFDRKGMVITVPATEEVDTYSVGISRENLSVAAGQGRLTMNTEIGSISAPSNMLEGVEGVNGSNVEIAIGLGDKSNLSQDIKDAIGDKPLIRLTLSVDGEQTDWNNPNGSVSVAVPYEPTEEELANTESLVVWYIDGSGKAVSIPNGHYNAETKTVEFDVTHFSDYAVAYHPVVFDDVASNAWYGKAVAFISARGISTGTGNGNFNPKSYVTRADFLVLLMRAYDISPTSNPKDNFVDAGNTYYTDYLAAAKELAITDGIGNNKFAPNQSITRQEMCTILYNVLNVMGQLPQGGSENSLASYADCDQVSSWAKNAIAELVQSGIISGNGGMINPKSTTTRAEMAQVLFNLMSE